MNWTKVGLPVFLTIKLSSAWNFEFWNSKMWFINECRSIFIKNIESFCAEAIFLKIGHLGVGFDLEDGPSVQLVDVVRLVANLKFVSRHINCLCMACLQMCDIQYVSYMLWYYVSIACIFQLNNCINWYLNADTSLSKGWRTTTKTSDEVIKEDNWCAGGRKKAAAWIGFFYSPFFFANFIRTAQVPHEDCAPSLWSSQPAGRRSCSRMTMLPVLTVWFESSGFNIFCLHFHFLFHLVNPAVEQGVLGKVHDCLLRSKACVSFHLLVFFLLWVAHTGRLDLLSKMVALTNCLHSGESLPVPLLELIWMWWLLANFWLAHLFKEGFHLKFSFRILFPQVVTVQMLWWLLKIKKQKSFFQIYEKE